MIGEVVTAIGEEVTAAGQYKLHEAMKRVERARWSYVNDVQDLAGLLLLSCLS